MHQSWRLTAFCMQVCFHLTIPCLLFTKTATAVAGASSGASLVGIPLCCAALVIAGYSLGLISGALVEGRLPWGRSLLGWQPQAAPPPVSAAVADSMARALGVATVRAAAMHRWSHCKSRKFAISTSHRSTGSVHCGCVHDVACQRSRHSTCTSTPARYATYLNFYFVGLQAAPALMPRPEEAPRGFGALVTVACGFGNCFTLPLLYLSALHPQHTAAATAFLAFFWMSWDPLFWTIGCASCRILHCYRHCLLSCDVLDYGIYVV